MAVRVVEPAAEGRGGDRAATDRPGEVRPEVHRRVRQGIHPEVHRRSSRSGRKSRRGADSCVPEKLRSPRHIEVDP
jgi:hypothetical protein